MTPAAPARIFAIRARNGQTATVFRRGPSKINQLLQWDLKTDRVMSGQWIRAAIYPRRSDLSPDGHHLIYFAATHKGGDQANWTAISRPPYWTALHFYGQRDAWNGGGVFLDNRHYWPDVVLGRSSVKKVASGLVREQAPPTWLEPTHGEDMVVYLPRLVRDGWTLDNEQRILEQSVDWLFKRTRVWTLVRGVRDRWQLIKKITASLERKGPYGEVYWETHWLSGPDGEIALHDEWAEVDGRSVIYAAKGRLYRLGLHRKGPDTPVCVADLSPNRFANVRAPYEGLRRKTA